MLFIAIGDEEYAILFYERHPQSVGVDGDLHEDEYAIISGYQNIAEGIARLSVHIYPVRTRFTFTKINGRDLSGLIGAIVDLEQLGRSANSGEYRVENDRIPRELEHKATVGIDLLVLTAGSESHYDGQGQEENYSHGAKMGFWN